MIAETHHQEGAGWGLLRSAVEAVRAGRARRREYRRVHDELVQYSASELAELGLHPADIRQVAETAAGRYPV